MELGHLENGCNPADSDAANTKDRDQHGHKGGTQTPEGSGGNVHHAANEVGQGNVGHADHAAGNCLGRVCDVNGKQLRTKAPDQSTQRQTNHHAAAQTDPKGIQDPLMLPGTGILANEIHGSLVESVQSDVNKAFDIAGGSVAGHEDIAEGIDRRLDQYIGNREQGTLDTGGQADPQHFKKLGLVKTHFLQIQAAGIGAFHEGTDYQDRRDGLGNGGSQCHTGHIHVQNHYEEQIQNYVDNACKGQVNQRAFGITGCTENGGAVVVYHSKGDAAKIDLHINTGKRKNGIRRTHHPKEALGEENTYKGEEDTAKQCHRHGCMHSIVNGFLFTAAKTVGNGNTSTHRKTDKQVDNQIGDGTGSTYGSYGNTAAEPSHHHQIRSVEQKLQYTGKKDRDGIGNNAGQQRSFQHGTAMLTHDVSFFLLLFQGYYTAAPEKCKSESITEFGLKSEADLVSMPGRMLTTV